MTVAQNDNRNFAARLENLAHRVTYETAKNDGCFPGTPQEAYLAGLRRTCGAVEVHQFKKLPKVS